jgi:hypothetical protein
MDGTAITSSTIDRRAHCGCYVFACQSGFSRQGPSASRGGADAVVRVHDVLVFGTNQVLRIVSAKRLNGCGDPFEFHISVGTQFRHIPLKLAPEVWRQKLPCGARVSLACWGHDSCATAVLGPSAPCADHQIRWPAVIYATAILKHISAIANSRRPPHHL